MATFNLRTGADSFTGDAAGDIFQGTANAISAGDVLDGGAGNDQILIQTGGGNPVLVNFNLPTTLANMEAIVGRTNQSDTFQISGARVAQFQSISGGTGTGTDTLALTGGGAISLNGKLLPNMDAITTDATDTNLTVTNQAMGLLVSNMGGSSDILTIGTWTGGNYVVADLFTMLTGRGIEQVAWTQSIHDFTAVLNGGTGFVDVTRTDFADARDYTTQVYSFESDGDLRQQITNFDDGAVSTTNYDANGVITDLTIDATAAARTYQTLANTYTGGLLDLSVLTANDGVTTTKDYDVTGPSSVLLTSVRDDVADAYAWDTITDTYTGGVLTQRVTLNDAGEPITGTEINYSGGVITDRTITYADGRLSETFFTGGVLDFVRNTAANGVDLTLVGGAGDNTLSGGAGNDLFVGGLGNDVFAFAGAVGADRISDFGNGQDRLDLLAYGYDSRADLDAANAVSQVGRNVVIDLGGNGSITLLNFDISNLDDNDFVV